MIRGDAYVVRLDRPDYQWSFVVFNGPDELYKMYWEKPLARTTSQFQDWIRGKAISAMAADSDNIASCFVTHGGMYCVNDATVTVRRYPIFD